MAEVRLLNEAVDDLRRIGPSVVPRVLKKLLLLEADPTAGHPLGGDLTGFRKLVAGRNDWRVVYRITAGGVVEIAEVWAVGARRAGAVYEEAAARLAGLPASPPTEALMDVVISLGKLAGGVQPTPPRRVEAALPEWLVVRLVHTAGLERSLVDQLDLEAALDAWTAYQIGQSGLA